MSERKRLEAMLQALRDTAQSASNAVASNVSGPVDLIAAGLRAAGVPVRKPVGGSEWMAEKGLTRDVEMGAPRIIGETLGMAGPTIAAAKAPQIAAGMIKAGENLAAPRTLNPQAGAIDPQMLGIPVNKDGTVTLYHGTTKDAAPKIVASRELRSAGEPNVYLTTAKDAGYGDGTLVSVDVHPRYLNLDDEFPTGRMDFSIDAPSKAFKVVNAKIIEALRKKRD